MAKIYKIGDQHLRRLNDYGRDALEEFPPKVRIETELPPPLVESGQLAPPPNPNLEEMRQSLLSELRKETQEMVEQAFNEGHKRGMEAGRKEFLDSTSRAVEMLEAVAQQMGQARQEFLDNLEPQVLELVKLISHRVLLREIRTDEDFLLSTVRRALEKIADRQRLRICIAPQDKEALRKHRVALLEEFNGIDELEITTDEAITPGGCTVDSELMHVDARLEVLLQNLLDEVLE